MWEIYRPTEPAARSTSLIICVLVTPDRQIDVVIV